MSVSLDCCYSKDVIASNSFSASSNIRFRRCHWRSFALWSPGSLECLQLTHLPFHSALCLAHRANRHGHFHLHHYPHEFWALRTDRTHLPIKGLLLHDGWQLQVLLVGYSSGPLRLLRPQILWAVRWGNSRGSRHWCELSFHFAPTQGEHDGYERWVKQISNIVFREFLCCHFAELFGVVPEDFMRKYLGEPPNPTEQQREDPFLKECQAANFTGLPHQDWKLNVTQVLLHFFIIEVFCSHVILYLCSTWRRWKSNQQNCVKTCGITESTVLDSTHYSPRPSHCYLCYTSMCILF